MEEGGGVYLQIANNQGGDPPLIGIAIAKEFKENLYFGPLTRFARVNKDYS